MKKLIAGNWKMAISMDEAERYDDETLSLASSEYDFAEWLVCAPFTMIGSVNNAKRGAQDCSAHAHGAYTGEISASMLRDMGCEYCIVGHSERRAMHAETSHIVNTKAKQVLDHGMTAIICVGETLEEREAGNAFVVVETQIKQSLPEGANANNTVIAYEPVWAIGTGRAATADDVFDMHGKIRVLLKSLLADGAQMRIIYGGSVKPNNAHELLTLDNVDGALIGGASLKPQDFIAIGEAVR